MRSTDNGSWTPWFEPAAPDTCWPLNCPPGVPCENTRLRQAGSANIALDQSPYSASVFVYVGTHTVTPSNVSSEKSVFDIRIYYIFKTLARRQRLNSAEFTEAETQLLYFDAFPARCALRPHVTTRYGRHRTRHRSGSENKIRPRVERWLRRPNAHTPGRSRGRQTHW